MSVRWEGGVCVLEPSKRAQRTLTVSGLALLAIAVAFPALAATDAAGWHAYWPLTVLGDLFFIVLGIACLYTAGPHVLKLDPATRTYEMVKGFPFAPARSKGTFEDIRGLRVEGHSATAYNEPMSYYLLVEWKWQLPRSPFMVCVGQDHEAANSQMHELSERLGIPIALF